MRTRQHGEPMEAPATRRDPLRAPGVLYAKCGECGFAGDVVQGDIIVGECTVCGFECCTHCAGSTDEDEGGVTFWCAECDDSEGTK